MPPSYLTSPIRELRSPVRLEILPDPPALFRHFAEAIASEIEANNQAGRPTRLILPVGPVGQYPLLAELCNRQGISWQNVHIFQMDEYCDGLGRLVPPEHPLCFRSYLRRELFDRLLPALRIPAEQITWPDPLRPQEMAARIAAVGGVDTCYGGIGLNGHVAFNEPPDPALGFTPEEFRRCPTRLVTIAPESVVMNAIRNTGGDVGGFPRQGVTIGMAEIYAAKRIRLYCPGGMWQRAVLRRALVLEPTASCPVTLLRDHPDYILYATEDTAAPAAYAL